MASDQIDGIIEDIRATEKTYQASSRVVNMLKDKTLTMLVGPVAIGKSYIIEQVSAVDPEFKQVPIFTTRDARSDDDPDLFHIRPHTGKILLDIQNKVNPGMLVQYTVHPTTGRVYGTEPEDYSVKYNLLPMLSGGINDRIQKPFAKTHILFIVARPEVWKMWLDIRYPTKNEERAKRIREATISLEWALSKDQPNQITWVENSIQNPEKTIDEVINIVKYNQQGDPTAREYAKQMLELVINER